MAVYIETKDGRRTQAVYVRHLRTLTGDPNVDIDLYRLPDGREIPCASPSNDGRVTPHEVDGDYGQGGR